MRATSRGKNGRFAKFSDTDMAIVEKKDFARPTSRYNTSKERAMQFQEGLWPNYAIPTYQTQVNGPKNMRKSINRVSAFIAICFWLIAILRIITRGIFWIVIFLLLKRMIQANDIVVFTTTLGSCLSSNSTSCYSKFDKAFFDTKQRLKSYWVSFLITESPATDAPIVYQIAFPLLFQNPIVLLLFAISTIIWYWVLGWIYILLIDINDTVNIAAPKQGLQEINHNAPVNSIL